MSNPVLSWGDEISHHPIRLALTSTKIIWPEPNPTSDILVQPLNNTYAKMWWVWSNSHHFPEAFKQSQIFKQLEMCCDQCNKLFDIIYKESGKNKHNHNSEREERLSTLIEGKWLVHTISE